MEPELLLLVCFICLFIIFAIVCTNIYMLWATRKQINEHQLKLKENDGYIRQINEDMSIVLAKIESGVKYKIDANAISILDLAEFKDLDPHLKVLYRRHILDNLAPAIMAGINKDFRNKDMNAYIVANDAQINAAIYDLARKFRYNGFVNTVSNK